MVGRGVVGGLGGTTKRLQDGKHFGPHGLAMECVMSAFTLDPEAWAKEQFAACHFNDSRRTQRLIIIASQAAARPDGSTPDQTETWCDCKAAYRLMDCDDVSHAEIIAPHCKLTKTTCDANSMQLILCDTTEIDFKRDVAGLGPVGKGTGRGFFLHTGIMRDAASGAISGMAGQVLYHRKPKSQKKVAKNTKRRSENRESLVWGELIDQIGTPCNGAKWLHVCDRGADDYEVYLRAYINHCGWVIRAARLNRKVLEVNTAPVDPQPMELQELIGKSVVQGASQVNVPRQGNRSARTAEVTIRFHRLRMPTPQRGNDWIRKHAPEEPLLMSVVELKEDDPPVGVDPLHWVLLTSEVVETLGDAQRILDHYKLRWGVEEYHKALKTGCQVENRYYETSARLERVTGLLAVLAVRLLQIRSLAADEPNRPANDLVPLVWIEVLTQVRKKSSEGLTIRQFVNMLGGLGGHLGRKRDGNPGWITLWRGLEKLLLILRGTRLKS